MSTATAPRTTYNRRELEAMSLKQLRNLDIKSPADEALVQEVIDAKVEDAPNPGNINRLDVPDIKSPEQEREWQKKIDARVARVKGRSKAKKTVAQAPVSKPNTPKQEMVDYTITQDDIDRNPELTKNGTRVGDVIQIPKKVAEKVDLKKGIVKAGGPGTKPPKAAATKGSAKTKERFCDMCDSKGGFHRANCPTKTLG